MKPSLQATVPPLVAACAEWERLAPGGISSSKRCGRRLYDVSERHLCRLVLPPFRAYVVPSSAISNYSSHMFKTGPSPKAPEYKRLPTMDSVVAQLRHDQARDFPREPGEILPWDGQVWKQSPLGIPEMWSEAVKSYSKTIASLAYPACFFWGEEMILMQNREWAEITGIHDQGQKQRGKLSADAFNALSTSLHGGVPKRVDSNAFLGDYPAGKSAHYITLISPLFDNANPGEHGADGSLVQLVPEPDHNDRGRNEEELSLSGLRRIKMPESGCDMSQLGDALEGISFDEHPFFHRFAEMLPTGLAILDHKAQAVFVNSHFYQLTTHRGEDQESKSWPQSIHPDDYDRVMEVYHDAFFSQKQLRTEFRALGQQNPWRLLFLTPLGDDNLRHVSLREYGGFICSVVDITSEKSAELAERKAAKDARERKEQQERFIDMISHEIRNPLSAMLHCSEDIDGAVSDPNDIDLASIKEAIETINVCIEVRSANIAGTWP